VAEQRSDGWKDWHILMAVFNIIFNYRRAVQGESLRDPAVRESWEPNAPEDPSDPMIDLAELNADALRKALMFSTGATVDALGLVIRAQFTPAELLRILATRYGYWENDIPHDDPFSANK
jgi:hypothetical protein